MEKRNKQKQTVFIVISSSIALIVFAHKTRDTFFSGHAKCILRIGSYFSQRFCLYGFVGRAAFVSLASSETHQRMYMALRNGIPVCAIALNDRRRLKIVRLTLYYHANQFIIYMRYFRWKREKCARQHVRFAVRTTYKIQIFWRSYAPELWCSFHCHLRLVNSRARQQIQPAILLYGYKYLDGCEADMLRSIDVHVLYAWKTGYISRAPSYW